MSEAPSPRPAKKARREADLYFLMAPPRHGAVELAAVLNLHKRIASFGTANPKRDEDEPCSCGQPVSSCPFWSELWEVLGVPEYFPAQTWFPSAPIIFRNEAMNANLMKVLSILAIKTGPWVWNIIREPAFTFHDMHSRFLAACQVWHPHQAFVDAQGSIPKLLAMVGMEFPVKGVIHLVRDPRSHAAWSKRYYPEIPVDRAVGEWVKIHRSLCFLKKLIPAVPFHRIRYEDLMDDIEGQSKKIIQIMGLKEDSFIGDALPRDKNHNLGQTGLSGDDLDWREILSKDEQARVLKAAGRLFIEFGYKNES